MSIGYYGLSDIYGNIADGWQSFRNAQSPNFWSQTLTMNAPGREAADTPHASREGISRLIHY
jgi:hypothetical protein